MLEGIDVSKWQGAVNWRLVREAQRRFAYAKATDGTTYVDPTFATNWPAILDAGLFRGAYHYGHPGRDAATQAVHFFSQVGALQAGDLPPMLDLEEDDGQSKDAVLNWTIEFLKKAETLFGRRLIIYTGGFWKYTLGDPSSSICERPLWLAQYASKPSLPKSWKEWAMWQYSGSGTVPGVHGAVDLDQFNGDEAALRELANAPMIAAPTSVPTWQRFLVWPAAPIIKGEDVAAWQTKCASIGHAVDVDGIYGPASKRTCLALQRNLGLNVDGIVGPKTWAGTFSK